MSETPRTEEAKFSGIHAHASEEYVDADFARTLERDLNEQAVANAGREAALLVKVARLERALASLQMELDASCNAEELRQVRAENTRLRAIFPKILEALQSGACSPDCSIEFMQQIPDEVRLVVGRLCLQSR